MSFNVPANLPLELLELATRTVEGVTDRDIDLLVRMVLVRVTACDNLVLRDVDIDDNAVEVALVLVLRMARRKPGSP